MCTKEIGKEANVMLNNIRIKISTRTKYIDPQLSVDWRKESINKTNEPPGDIESDCNWKQDNTAK